MEVIHAHCAGLEGTQRLPFDHMRTMVRPPSRYPPLLSPFTSSDIVTVRRR